MKLARRLTTFCLLTTAAVFSAANPIYAARNIDCIVFEDRNMKGKHMILKHGEMLIGDRDPGYRSSSDRYVYRYNRWWNDRISSLEVRKGCRLELHQHIDKPGARLVATIDMTKFPSGWNDEAGRAACICQG